MANFNLNKVIIGGRLTADPELKQTQNGAYVVSFSVAVNRHYTAKNSEENQTDFINMRAWRQTAEFISKYFKKGSSICVSGSIQTRTWTDQQNVKRYATEVVVDEAYFVDAKGESTGYVPSQNDAPAFQTQQEPKFEELSDDDNLPF